MKKQLAIQELEEILSEQSMIDLLKTVIMQHIAGSLIEGNSKIQLALQELEEILSEKSTIQLPQTVSMKRIAAGQEGNEDTISSSGTRGNWGHQGMCNIF
jgi:hypothetical protein